MVTEIVTAIFSDDLERSKQFYVDLLELEVIFDSDWVVQLFSSANESINLTLQPRNHDLIPEEFRRTPQGFSIAFVVPDCQIYKKALTMGLKIVLEPRNEAYGQRRFLTVDPNGHEICSGLHFSLSSFSTKRNSLALNSGVKHPSWLFPFSTCMTTV